MTQKFLIGPQLYRCPACSCTLWIPKRTKEKLLCHCTMGYDFGDYTVYEWVACSLPHYSKIKGLSVKRATRILNEMFYKAGL